MNSLKVLFAVLLAVSFLGITVKDCAICAEKCCPPDICVMLNLDQAPASTPDVALPAPVVKLFLLAVLTIVALLIEASSSARLLFAFRSDPGRRFALSRAQLHSWTL